MCTYTYIRIYVCEYMRLYVYILINMHIYVSYVNARASLCVCAYAFILFIGLVRCPTCSILQICTSLSLLSFLSVCSLPLYACTYTSIFSYVFTYSSQPGTFNYYGWVWIYYVHVHTKHIYIYIYKCSCTYIYIYIHIYIHIYLYIYMHVYLHHYVCVCMYIYIWMYTYVYKYL